MAGHQLLDTTQAIGTFPITKISPGSVREGHFSAKWSLVQWQEFWSRRVKPFKGQGVREFNVVPKTFKNSKQTSLVLLFRWWWTIKFTEAAPVCLSQKLFSLFHLNLVGVPIPGVIVGTVLIVSRYFEKGSMFNFLFDIYRPGATWHRSRHPTWPKTGCTQLGFRV